MHSLRRPLPAVALTAIVAVLDGVLADSAILLPLLLCGPLVAAATCRVRPTAAVGAMSLALALALGAA
jgi:hypothetical protein